MWTFKQLILHSKYLQTSDRKIIKADLDKKKIFFLPVACNLYDFHLMNETVSSIYKLFKFIYPSIWVKFDKIETDTDINSAAYHLC